MQINFNNCKGCQVYIINQEPNNEKPKKQNVFKIIWNMIKKIFNFLTD